ncbi:MAG: RNA polymerase sigma factor [Phycisphaerae bacterium]
MDWITTSTMLERLRDRDDAEMWERFAMRFRKPLHVFISRFGLDSSAADDAVQETMSAFFEAYRRGRYDRAGGRLSSWLFGIAFRQALNAKRRKGRDGARFAQVAADETSFFDRVPSEEEARSVWDEEWEKATLEACLARIRSEVAEHTYLAFHGVVREGRSAEEMASSLGIQRDAVYVAKHRVLKRLGELVQEYERPDAGS